jgi:hypothetical protein
MQLVVALIALGACHAFSPVRFTARTSQLNMVAKNDAFSALEKKLSEKSTAATTVATPEKKVEAKKIVSPTPKATAAPAPRATVAPQAKVAPAKVNPAPPKVTTAPAKTVTAAPVIKKAEPVVIKSTAVAPSQPSALSGGEFFAGVGLGLTPFLILPAVLLSAAKSLVKAPKPLPVPDQQKVKVQPYNKPLGVGAKEGGHVIFKSHKLDVLMISLFLCRYR